MSLGTPEPLRISVHTWELTEAMTSASSDMLSPRVPGTAVWSSDISLPEHWESQQGRKGGFLSFLSGLSPTVSGLPALFNIQKEH